MTPSEYEMKRRIEGLTLENMILRQQISGAPASFLDQTAPGAKVHELPTPVNNQRHPPYEYKLVASADVCFTEDTGEWAFRARTFNWNKVGKSLGYHHYVSNAELCSARDLAGVLANCHERLVVGLGEALLSERRA